MPTMMEIGSFNDRCTVVSLFSLSAFRLVEEGSKQCIMITPAKSAKTAQSSLWR